MKIEVNGIRLAYETWGMSARPMVLIHGFGLDRSIWRNLAMKHLGDQGVILPDVRGHGESDSPTCPYDMSLLAQDLAHLLETLGVAQAVVCGHSMGGYIALAFAEQFPRKLGGLGLITTNASSDSEDKRAGRYELIEQVHARGAAAVADSLARRLSQDPQVVDRTHELICQTNPSGLIGALEGMAERPDRSTLLTKLDVPALVVAGEEDQFADLAGTKAMAAALPKGDLISLPGAGHMPMLEAPEALGRGLQSLIARTTH